MAWTAPRTWVTSEVPTATIMNAHVRDNMKARVWEKAEVLTSQTTTSTAFVDLTTTGPALTLSTDDEATVIVQSFMSNSTTGYVGMGYAVSGATTIAADDPRAGFWQPGVAGRAGRISCIAHRHRTSFSPLTPGSNTFTAKYHVSAGTGTYQDRRMFVIADG